MATNDDFQRQIDEISRNAMLSQEQKAEQIRQINLGRRTQQAKIAQDLILSGAGTYNSLTRQQQIAFTDFATTRGAAFSPNSKYNPAAVDSINTSINQMVSDVNNQLSIPGWMKTVLKPIETAASGMYWVWSNVVSRPTSFGFLNVHSGIQYISNLTGATNDDIMSFSENWKAAKEFSPAQTLIMAPMTENQLKDRGIDLRDPKNKGWRGEDWFTHGWQKWTTGLLDAAYSFWADPFVLTGKAVGGVRRATYVKPGLLGQTDESIGRITARADGQKLFGAIDAAKARSTIDGIYDEGLAINRVRKYIPTVKRSAASDRLATALVMAEDATQQGLVMRSAMGDVGALGKLSQENADLARVIENGQVRKQQIDSVYSAMPIAAQDSVIGQAYKTQIDQITAQLKLADRQSGFYSAALASAGKVDKLYFNRFTTPVGIKARQLFGELPTQRAEFAGIRSAAHVITRNFFTPIVRVLRSPVDTRPTGWVNLREADSYKTVEAAYRDLPAGFFGADDLAVRASMVGEYTAAHVTDRPMLLMQQEAKVVSTMAARHGIDSAKAKELYLWYNDSRAGAQRAIQQGGVYSGAPFQGNLTADIIDHSASSGSIMATPILSSQAAGSHFMMNFDDMNRLLKISGGAIDRLMSADPKLFQRIRLGAMRAGDTIGDKVDTLGRIWKVSQLARIGYGPRAIGDEFAGQVAALGGLAMLGRISEGVSASARGAMVQMTRGAWQYDRRIAVSLDNVLNEGRMVEFRAASDELHQKIATLDADVRTGGYSRSAVASKMREIEDAKAELAWVDQQHATARTARENGAAFVRETAPVGSGKNGRITRRDRQGLSPVQVANMFTFAGPYRGATGAMYRSSLSSRTTFAMQFGTDADRVMRDISGNGWTTITVGHHGEKLHLQTWLRDLNMQIRNDGLARQVLQGKDLGQLEAWLRTSEGRAYRSQHPMGMQMQPRELADRVKTHVDYYLDPNVAGADILRQSLLTRDLKGDELKNVFTTPGSRPNVNGEQLSYVLGQGKAAATTAKILDGFYKYMNALPAEYLSRNPLFRDLYRSHINDLGKGMVAKGKTSLSPAEYDRLEDTAKALALRDTKALTFNMDYESRLTHAVRFVYPFMGAQSESWARWGKIIADKPQVIAHAGNLYNSPMRMGVTTDVNGNPVGPDGYATNIETGERYKVDKTEVMLNVAIPKGLRNSLAKLIGMDASELQIPLNSFNLVAPDKTWFIPSAGPVVQIPVNQLVTSGFLGIPPQFDKADLFADLGVLPYGPRDSWVDFINPASGRRLGDSQDEYSGNYQKAMFEIAQEEAWKYENGMRSDPPDWSEIKDRAKKYTTFKFFMNFVSPVVVDTNNPYQFFRDAYKRMLKEDPQNGEIAFRDKYGDSLWMFAQTLNKNNGGLPASDSAVKTSAAFRSLTDSLSDPSLLRLIGGPYASGSFSPGAYYYQLNTPIQTGSDMMQREKLTARQAIEKAQADEGWYQYNKVLTRLQAELYSRGLQSFDDKGAEDLLTRKKGVVLALSRPYDKDGNANEYYNPQWEKDYNTIDRGAYERRIDDMWKIVNNPIMQAMAVEGSRTDIASLRDYLLLREGVQTELSKRETRGGSISITAKKNSDLRQLFNVGVNQIIEKDTRFGELHNRYLSRDMGYDKSFMDEEED